LFNKIQINIFWRF